jgi:6-phosphogluconolactonase
LQTSRITMTVPVLNSAATIAFMVAGHDKQDALHAVLEGPRNPEEYPSQLIAPADGDVYYLLDRVAAEKLTQR